MKSCVTFRRAFAALIIALAALLVLASCNKQPSLAKQPSPAKQKPSASLLAADIAKLGFIPGQPVTMPPGFKAECTEASNNGKGYDFADGSYVVHSDGTLSFFMLNSTKSLRPGGVRPGMTEQQAKAQREQAAKYDKEAKQDEKIIGPVVPPEQRSTLGFITWDKQDLFSMTLDDVIKAYGSPSSAIPEPMKLTMEFGMNIPPFEYYLRTIEYLFEFDKDQYCFVRFVFCKFGESDELVDGIVMLPWQPSDEQPVSGYKIYKWPKP